MFRLLGSTPQYIPVLKSQLGHSDILLDSRTGEENLLAIYE
jgi:hypothetical protein